VGIEILIILIKASLILGTILGLASLNIWIERKASALIQDRIGANRASLFGTDLMGIWNTLIADPVKAITKEDFLPKGASQFQHSLAPFLAVVPVILSFAVIPFGPSFKLGEREITLQLSDLNVGLLYVFAMGSLSIYGVVLAGWVSNNKFALFGCLRASAQMISYEITMGISLIGLLAVYQSVDLNEIVAYQGQTLSFFGLVIPAWGIILNPIACIIFFVSIMAETKRAPFDLPESESEIVAGYLTEYSGMKFLLFWLGEFSEIVVASALITTLFLGGWQLPYVNLSQMSYGPLIGAFVFLTKVISLSVLQVVIRWTLPRFRYDQLMNLCWKIMLPLSVANLIVTVAILLWIVG